MYSHLQESSSYEPVDWPDYTYVHEGVFTKLVRHVRESIPLPNFKILL